MADITVVKIKTVIFNKRNEFAKVGSLGVTAIKYIPLAHPGEKEAINIFKNEILANTVYDIDEVIYEPIFK